MVFLNNRSSRPQAPDMVSAVFGLQSPQIVIVNNLVLSGTGFLSSNQIFRLFGWIFSKHRRGVGNVQLLYVDFIRMIPYDSRCCIAGCGGHANAVDRIKQWMEKKKEEEESGSK